MIAIVGAVIHADHGNRKLIMEIAVIKKGSNLANIAFAPGWSIHKIGRYDRKKFAFSVDKAVALFGNGKACHL